MAKLTKRLGRGFWDIEYKGMHFKRKVIRQIKGNFVIINGEKIKVN